MDVKSKDSLLFYSILFQTHIMSHLEQLSYNILQLCRKYYIVVPNILVYQKCMNVKTVEQA